jgi:hypothetical protein
MVVKKVIDRIVTDLKTLPFLTKVGGLVKVAVRKNANGQNVSFPVEWNNDIQDCNASDEIIFVPDSKEKGMCYFELISSQNTKKLAGAKEYEYRVRLVAWYDSRWFENYDIALVHGAVQNKIKSYYVIPGANYIRSTTISFVSDEPQKAAVFGAYGYDETKAQYLRRPYDYFSLVYSIKIIVDNSCFEGLVIKTELC